MPHFLFGYDIQLVGSRYPSVASSTNRLPLMTATSCRGSLDTLVVCVCVYLSRLLPNVFVITESGCIRTLDKALSISTLRPLKMPTSLLVPFGDRLPLILEAKTVLSSRQV